MRRWTRRWWPFGLLVALAAAFVLLFVQVQHQQDSLRRDQDAIERGRLHSCQQTYRSFPEVFRPFFPADRKTWPPMVRRNWAKLIKRTDELARGCSQQIQP